MSAPAVSRPETRILTGVFLAALVFHLWAVTYNWKMAYMAGHEFRQAQTAITTYYIDQQNNFGLLYETPILGKPWVSILMEVPIYEWTVVLVSRVAHISHLSAARGVSTASFYLMLPAIYLLLGRLGLAKPRRLLALALILVCPVYIYYTRAFLMDAMAEMFCAWFLLGFVRTMDERRWSWLALTIVAGTLAALIKSAILAVWLWPAAGYGAWLLWRDLRARTGWQAPVKTILWGVATIVVAMGTLRAWIIYTDPIKAAHDSAWIFTSKNLAQGNWGLFDFKSLFSGQVWGFLLGCWDQAVMSRWVIGAIVLLGLALNASRWAMLGIGGIFFLAQAMFPFAYAYQDYYFYSCALFLCIAFAYVLFALLDSRLPRAAVAMLFLVPFAAELNAYRVHYRPFQEIWAEGGYPITNALRELTPKNSVLVVAGADWAAMTPLYAQRRALMIRNGLEYDADYLERAFKRLEDEDVSAVVLVNDARNNRDFLERVARRFDLDSTQPTFSWASFDVYIPRAYRKNLELRIKASARYPQLTLPRTEEDGLVGNDVVLALSDSVARNAFGFITPAPYQYRSQYGVGWIERGSGVVLSTHPDTTLWLRPPANATQIKWGFGIFSGAYEDPGKSTNGVEFIVEGEMPDGTLRRIHRHVLDPREKTEDRGDQEITIPYTPEPGEVLRFETRPNDNSAFDWAYWTRIEVK